MNLLTEITRIKKLMRLNEDVLNNVTIRQYNEETDFKQIYSRLPEIYKNIGWPVEAIWAEIEPVESISVVIDVDGKVGGFYFLRESNIPAGGDPKAYEILKDLRGVEGVALGIFEEYKGLGFGKKLINYPSTMGYDYIWGYQLKSLGNIDDWLKRRKIYADTEGLYVTYQIFNSNEQSN